MSRQILTFIIVFAGIMLLFQTCRPKTAPPKGLSAETVAREQESFPLEGAAGSVLLARDGSVLAVGRGEEEFLRRAPAARRPFHILLKTGLKTTTALPPAEWTSVEIDQGRRFTWSKDAVVVEKTVRLTDEGLVLDLRVEGANENGLILTGASGVALSGIDDAARSFAFWQLKGSTPTIRSWQDLSQGREQHPVAGFAEYLNLRADDQVERFGILGRDAYVALEQIPPTPPTNELYIDIYRAARAEGETDEIETWLDLVTRKGVFEGTFRLRWLPRADVPESLRGTSDIRPATVYWLEDETFRVAFTDRGAAIREMWLKKFSTVAGETPSRETWIPILRSGVRVGERPFTLSSNRFGGSPAYDVWETEVAGDGRSILFTLDTPAGFRLSKRVTLPPAGRYDLGIEVEIVRPERSRAEAAQYTFIGPAGSYIADAYREIIGADRPAGFLLERTGGKNDKEPIDSLVKGDELRHTYGEDRGLLTAVGTRGAYFSCALVTEERRDADGRLAGTVTQAVVQATELNVAIEREKGDPSRDTMVASITCSVPFDGGIARDRYRLYAGPNQTEALKELGIEDAVNYGWFGFIGKVLMWLMKLLQGIVGSYGVAIMLMTLIVRGMLLPVSFKTQLSMQRYSKRLAKIKPILDELQKKYADNTQKMGQERMKVMREHGIGLPLGCLMIFVQIPIWFALFQALRVEFAIRHQSFLWANDLSMPDHLLALSFWPHWFNLLPILMLVLWVTQQKLAPTPGGDDPQVKMQMKMMKFMPFVFFFMLYNYTAALALYMCMSSLWSIAESKLVRRAVARMDV